MECAKTSVFGSSTTNFTPKGYSCTEIQLRAYYLRETVKERELCLIKMKVPCRKQCCTDCCCVMMTILKKKSQLAIQQKWVTLVQSKEGTKYRLMRKSPLEKTSICLQNLHLVYCFNSLVLDLSLLIITKHFYSRPKAWKRRAVEWMESLGHGWFQFIN